MAGFDFNKDGAMSADNGGYISVGGVYVGFVTKMISFKNDSGAGGVELSLETNNGEKCDYVKIYTQNKDGSENFARGKINALCGILELSNLPAVNNNDKYSFPIVYNKKIAFALKREEYMKSDGITIGWKMELLHFFHHDSLQTYREHIEGSPADVSKREIKDIIVGPSSKNTMPYEKKGTPQFEDDDLPF